MIPQGRAMNRAVRVRMARAAQANDSRNEAAGSAKGQKRHSNADRRSPVVKSLRVNVMTTSVDPPARFSTVSGTGPVSRH